MVSETTNTGDDMATKANLEVHDTSNIIEAGDPFASKKAELHAQREDIFNKQHAIQQQMNELNTALELINNEFKAIAVYEEIKSGKRKLDEFETKTKGRTTSTPRTPRDPNAPVRVRGSGKPAPLEEELIEQFRELGGVTTKAKLMELRGVASDDKQGYARLSNLLNALSKKEPLPFITKTGERGGYRLQEEAIKEASAS